MLSFIDIKQIFAHSISQKSDEKLWKETLKNDVETIWTKTRDFVLIFLSCDLAHGNANWLPY